MSNEASPKRSNELALPASPFSRHTGPEHANRSRCAHVSVIRSVAVLRAAVCSRRVRAVGLPLVALVAGLACSSNALAAPTTTTRPPERSAAIAPPPIAPPPSIAKAKQLVVCSDEVEPPFAYRQGSKLTGSEVDIMNAVGRLFGVKTVYSQIGFDGLFAALDAGKCNAAIDEVSDTVSREQSIADVDYMSVGQTFMVKHGNPLGLKSFADLCGHSVGAVLASVDLTYLQTLSKACRSRGKSGIDIRGFNDDPTGTVALTTGKIDAFEEDTPILEGLIARAGGGVQLSPQRQTQRIPCGIAIAKSDGPLQGVVKSALNELYANGSMQSILARYHESAVALSGRAPVKVDAAK